MIENVLRHIYFRDHPVEFERANRERKWFMSVDGLFKYATSHYVFCEDKASGRAIQELRELYDELSATVHGRKVAHLEMRAALLEVVFDQDVFDKQCVYVAKCAEAANFLLLVFHRDQASRFPDESRRIILDTLGAQARQAWQGLR